MQSVSKNEKIFFFSSYYTKLEVICSLSKLLDDSFTTSICLCLKNCCQFCFLQEGERGGI